MNKKALGVLVLLVVVMVATGILKPAFASADNLQNLTRWIGLYGILSIGMAFVLITGGVDLSVGSIVGLVGALLFQWIRGGMAVPLAVGLVLALSVVIGVIHGLLITKLRLQPFVVTLCGLFIYRSMARFASGDQAQGIPQAEHESLFALSKSMPVSLPIPGIGDLGLPTPFLIMIGLGSAAAWFLNRTIWGRYLLALGNNEQAARYSGIRTDRMVVLAYVLSALAAGIGGVLFALHVGTVQPSVHGSFYELYAIAGAVLGGCSLRGGEGSILGVILGASLVRVLYNAINLLGISTELEFAVIGIIILAGVISDELLRRLGQRRLLRRAGHPGDGP